MRTDHLTDDAKTKALDALSMHLASWEPQPACDVIRIVALTAGDTLVMPPGTIHAPITISDALFTGAYWPPRFMVWQTAQTWQLRCQPP